MSTNGQPLDRGRSNESAEDECDYFADTVMNQPTVEQAMTVSSDSEAPPPPNRSTNTADGEQSERGEKCVPEVIRVLERADVLLGASPSCSSLRLDALTAYNCASALKNSVDRLADEMNQQYNSDVFAAGILRYHQTRTLQNEDNKMVELEKWAMKVFPSAICDYVGLKGVFGDESDVFQKSRPQGRLSEGLECLPVAGPSMIDVVHNEKKSPEFFINHIMEALIQREKLTKAPVPLYVLLINPHSFSETVENMFYFGHVLEKKLVVMTFDEDQLPLISAKVNTRGKKRKLQSASGKDWILDMDKELWKRLIAAYHLKDPVIPSRSDNAP